MPPKLSTQQKKLQSILQVIGDLVHNEEASCIVGTFLDQAVKLQRALTELEALQAPFNLVDSDLSWSYRSSRQQEWLSNHPGFRCLPGVELSDTLPVSQGSRGLVTREAIDAGQSIFTIPQTAMFTTSVASSSPDFGAFLKEDAAQALVKQDSMLLGITLMVENARCYLADLARKDTAAGGSSASAVAAAGGSATAATAAAATATVAATEKGADVAVTAASTPSAASTASASAVPVLSEKDLSSIKSAAAASLAQISNSNLARSKSSGSMGTNSSNSSSGSVSASSEHGHSHGGVACHGHGHTGGSNSASASGTASSPPPSSSTSSPSAPSTSSNAAKSLPTPRTLQSSNHEWGSYYRAYVSMLPKNPACCLSFTTEQLTSLVGFTQAQFDATSFFFQMARTYFRLYPFFGASPLGGQCLSGFQEYYTWAHFKWAMSVVVSRQNAIPLAMFGSTTTTSTSGGDENAAASTPHSHATGGSKIALIPLFDMVNSMKGPLTSFFFGAEKTLVLDAGRPFAAGEQVLMSYGSRSSYEKLQYMGYVSASIDEPDANEYTIVEASMGGLDADPLFRIRANVLKSLYITPDVHSARYISNPLFVKATKAAVKNLEGKEAMLASEKVLWAQPYTFRLGHDGRASADLLSFLRIACIANKAEAAEALKQCDATRKAIIAKNEAIQKAKAEHAAADLAKRQQSRDEELAKKAGGESFVATTATLSGSASTTLSVTDSSNTASSSPPSSSSATATSPAAGVASEDLDAASMALSRLSLSNELAAQQTLQAMLRNFIKECGKGGPISREKAEAGDAIETFRALHHGILRKGLALATAAVAALLEEDKAAKAATT